MKPERSDGAWARRARLTRSSALRESRADRLSPGEIDPVSGTLDWPGVLKQSMFAEERERLEDLFANWTEYGSVGFEQRRQIRSTTDAMLGKLKQHVNDMPPPEYVTAKRFLESLAYEAYLAAS